MGRPETAEARTCAEYLIHLGPRFSRWLATRVQQDRPVGTPSPRQLEVLAFVGDGAPTLGDLATALQVTPAVVTGLVDRLERRGHVLRQADARDCRVVRLQLTDAGRETRAAAERAVVVALVAVLVTRPGEEVEALHAGLVLLEQALLGIPPEPPAP